MSITVADIPHWRRLFDPTGQPAGYVWTTDGAGGGSYQPAGGGGGNTIIVEDEGTPLATAADTLNFTGAGVTASGTGTTKTINVPGASNTITIEDEGTPLTTDADTLNFTGAGVTASGTGTTKTIDIPGGGLFIEDAQANIIGGSNAAQGFTTFASNNFVGGSQAYENFATSPDFSIALGNRAARYATGSRNVTIGYEAGRGFSTAAHNGTDNVYIGYRCGVANTGSVSQIVAVGQEAGNRCGTGANGGTFVGAESGGTAGLTGPNNSCFGFESGFTLGGSCTNNTLLGKGAGRVFSNVANDSNNICLGNESGPTTAGVSSRLYLDVTQRDDPLIGGDFVARTVSLQNMVFDADQTIGATEDNYVLTYDDGTGLISLEPAAGGSGGAFTLDSVENLYAGTGALASLTTGIENFAAGLRALNLLQNSNYCIAIGSDAGANITTLTSGNVCIGLQAVSGLAASSLRGSYNVGVGYEALALLSGFNTNYNIGIGGFAGSRVSTGDFNTFVGGRSGPITSALTGNLNTGLGYQAGRRLQGTSQRNTFIGNDTGFNILTGNENICLGDSAGPTTLNQSQKLYIDINTTDNPIIFGDLNALVRTIAINGQFESTGNSGSTSFRVDNNATATETRMLLWDVDNATLARVSVGSANSAGAGFKVLRIPN